jgi:hypothetical protein
MIVLNSKIAGRYVRFLETVTEHSHGQVGFNQDIIKIADQAIFYFATNR